MAKQRQALGKVLAKVPRKKKKQTTVVNVYIEKIEVGKPAKEKNPIEKVLTWGMTLARVLTWFA